MGSGNECQRFEQRQRSEFRDCRVRGSIGQSDEQFEYGLCGPYLRQQSDPDGCDRSPCDSAKLIASDSSLNRDIDRPGYQLALADETITLKFETSERVETPSSLTINGQSGITVSSQSGDTTG